MRSFGDPRGRPLVVLHSAGLDGDMFEGFARDLQRYGRYRVIAPDLRGHGGSAGTSEMVTIDGMVQDVVALASEWGGDADLIGTSMGAVVASRAAHSHPQLWRSVSLFCVPARGAPAFAERGARARTEGMAPLVEETLGRWFDAKSVAGETASVTLARQKLQSMRAEDWASAWESFAEFPGHLPLALPVRCFAADQDQSTPPSVVEEVRHMVGSADPLTLLRGGHQVLLEDPEQCAQAWAGMDMIWNHGRTARASSETGGRGDG